MEQNRRSKTRDQFTVLVLAILLFGFFLAWTQRQGTESEYYPRGLSSLDPATAKDNESRLALRRVYETLLSVDSQTGELVPELAAELPKVERGGKVYRFRLRADRFFREAGTGEQKSPLTADDVAYSLKRIHDPRLRLITPSEWGEIEGIEAFRKQALQSERTDYSAAVAGIRVLNAHEIEIRFRKPPSDGAKFFSDFTTSILRDGYSLGSDQAQYSPQGTGAYYLQSSRPPFLFVWALAPKAIEGALGI